MSAVQWGADRQGLFHDAAGPEVSAEPGSSLHKERDTVEENVTSQFQQRVGDQLVGNERSIVKPSRQKDLVTAQGAHRWRDLLR